MIESIKESRKIRHEGWKRPWSWYDQYICMRISVYITKLLIHTPITANQVTLINVFLGILGPVFLFNGFFITGLLLIHLTVVLDSVDGEIASYRKKYSMLGTYIDAVYHTIVNPLMLFGFAYGIYNLFPNKLLLIFGFLSAIFAQSVVVPPIFDTIVSMKIRGEKPPKIGSKVTGKEVAEYEGQTTKFKNPLLKIYHTLRQLWAFPNNLVLLTVLYGWEVANLKYGFVPPFLTTLVFFVGYGSYVMLNNAISFVFHVKKNSIDSFYVFLFGKK